MRILVTGGSGFIGQHLVLGLTAQNHTVRVLDILEGPLGNALPTKNYEFMKGDIFNPDDLNRSWYPEPDVVIHLVGMADAGNAQRDPERSFLLNVSSVERVLEMCRTHPVKRFIVPSSAAVYGAVSSRQIDENHPLDPNNIYGWHKAIAETVVQAYSQCYQIAYTIPRLFNVYGRGHKGVINLALSHAYRNEPLKIYGGDQYRDFVYAGDVVEALIRIILTPASRDQIINIGSGKGTTIRDAIKNVQKVCPDLRVTFGENSEMALYDSVSDISKARMLLDWFPQNASTAMSSIIKKEMVVSGDQ